MKNRIFEISIYIDSSENISGGQMSVTYDSSIAQFREISSDIYEVAAKDNGDKVQIVFASAHKVDCTDNIKALTLKFKSISSGTFDMILNCSECVDYNLCDIAVVSESAVVSVTERAVSVSSTKEKISYKGEKSTVSENIEATSQQTSAHTYISGIDNTTKSVLVGIGSATLVIALFIIGILLGRKTDKLRVIKKEDKSD